MSFQAFFDDSGGRPAFVLSGYVSSVDSWTKFSNEWQALLDEAPVLQYFKMREAASCEEQFRPYKGKEKERNERLGKFLRLIQTHTQVSVSSVIPLLAFDKILKGRIDEDWDDPFFCTIFDVISILLETHTRLRIWGAVSGALDFIFDDQPRLAAKVPAYYQRIREGLHPLAKNSIAPSPKFEDDKVFLPLQAADVQSWYFRRLFAERFNNEPFRLDLPKSVFEPLEYVRSAMHFWTPRLMKAVATKTRAKERLNPVHFKDIHDLIANADFEAEE